MVCGAACDEGLPDLGIKMQQHSDWSDGAEESDRCGYRILGLHRRPAVLGDGHRPATHAIRPGTGDVIEPQKHLSPCS